MEDMLAHFRSRLAIIEGEFGSEFLERGSDHELKPTGKNQHYVRYHCRVATRFLKRREKGSTDLRNESLALMVELADVLDSSRTLPGFDSEIRERLKDPVAFGPAIYECVTACLYSRIGDVEFVPRAEGRTPDLKISRGGQVVWVECLRKDRIEPTPIDYQSMPRLKAAFDGVSGRLSAGLDVFIMVVGLDEQALVRAVEETDVLIARGKTGRFFNRAVETCVSIDAGVPPPPDPLPAGATAGLWIRGDLAHGSVSGKIVVDEHGKYGFENTKKIELCRVDSHKFKAVLNSLDRKRKHGQIPVDGVGVFHFDVDVENVSGNFKHRYMEGVAGVLAKQLWAGGHNSRIGGIVITAGPFFSDVQADGGRFLRSSTHRFLMNRGSVRSLPDWFSV